MSQQPPGPPTQPIPASQPPYAAPTQAPGQHPAAPPPQAPPTQSYPQSPQGPPPGARQPRSWGPGGSTPSLVSVGVALGVALLTTAIALSSTHTRADGDLDWSNYALGILATLGLLGVAGAAYVLVKDTARRDELVGWPGAFGAIGVGSMVVLALDDSGATGYVAGLAIVAISVGGYLLVRRPAFVVTAIAGLLVLYLSLVDDIFDIADIESDNVGITISAVVLVFTVLITAAGWFLPTRVLSGVVVGVFTVVVFTGVLTGLAVAAAFQAAFAGFSLDGDAPAPTRFDEYDNDVWVILVFAVLLIAGWAAAAWLSGHVGFRLLMVAMATGVVPLATVVLAVEHPTWWAAVTGVLGGAILVAVAFLSLGGHSRSGGPGPGFGDPNDQSSRQGHPTPPGPF